MALIFESMTGEPLDFIIQSGGKEKEPPPHTNKITNGVVVLKASDFVGSNEKDSRLTVHFYQDGGEGRMIEAPNIKFSVMSDERIVAVQGFSEKGEVWGSELIKEQEAVMVYFKNEGELQTFFARNDLQVS